MNIIIFCIQVGTGAERCFSLTVTKGTNVFILFITNSQSGFHARCQLLIRSNLGFSILFKDPTESCSSAQGSRDLNQLPITRQLAQLPLLLKYNSHSTVHQAASICHLTTEPFVLILHNEPWGLKWQSLVNNITAIWFNIKLVNLDMSST